MYISCKTVELYWFKGKLVATHKSEKPLPPPLQCSGPKHCETSTLRFNPIRSGLFSGLLGQGGHRGPNAKNQG